MGTKLFSVAAKRLGGDFGGKKTNKQKNNEKELHERGFSKLKASRAKNF